MTKEAHKSRIVPVMGRGASVVNFRGVEYTLLALNNPTKQRTRCS